MTKLNVNGVERTVKASPDTPLLYVLRNELGVMTPKFGCGMAQCGACSVLIDGAEMRACVTPIAAHRRQRNHDSRRVTGALDQAAWSW